MTGMEYAIEKAAEIIGGHVDHYIGIEPDQPLDAARALAEAGLIAPAPLRVNQAAAEATARYGVRTDRSGEFKAFCAGAMWAVDRAEGDGSADQ